MTPDEEFVHGEPPLSVLFPDVPAAAPLEIEFGTGKARFLIESGRLHPDRRFLGVERSLAYYRIARDRIAGSRLPNVRVIRADGAEMVERLPPASVSGLHAYFLDPWPKKKQRKRRLLGERFLASAGNAASPAALFRIVTDHEDYGASIASAIESAIAAGAPWRPIGWDSATPPPPTHYELKYRAAGRSFRRFLLVRIEDRVPSGK